jgi:cytochrome c-type biogenesis protein CcmH
MKQTKAAKLIVWLSLIGAVVFSYAMVPRLLLAQEEPDFNEINEIAKQLNCPTCAGINLADCRTLTCEQWRTQIGDLLQEGYTEPEIIDYFASRYGTQVLQEPPRSGFTLLLWVLPVVIVVGGGAWLYYLLRGWSKAKPMPAAPQAGRPQAGDTNDDYLSLVEQDLGLDET